jgi:hypothetical protein
LQFRDFHLDRLIGQLLFGRRRENSAPGPAPSDPNLRKKVGIPEAVKNHLATLGCPTLYLVVQCERALVLRVGNPESLFAQASDGVTTRWKSAVPYGKGEWWETKDERVLADVGEEG